MSEEASFEESECEIDISLNDLSLSVGSANIEKNTSVSELESLEVYGTDSSLIKGSGEIFKSDSDIETTVTESYSEDTGSSSSFVKESIEDVYEVEAAGDGSGSKSSNDGEQTIIGSNKSAVEVFEACSSFSIEKETTAVVLKNEQGGTENKAFDNAEKCTDGAKLPKFTSEALKVDSSTSDLEKVSVKDLLEDEAKQGVAGNESESVTSANQSAAVGKKSPQSLAESLKGLSISDSPNSTTEASPRQSRFRARTLTIFDSPYNTRLKARMIKEREARSRSEGGIN